MIYLTLFLTFLEIGAFTFGGGMAMIPLISQEVCNHGWLTENELLDLVAISESTPGPLAVNVSTFVGYNVAGKLGALCSTIGVILPSFVIILIVAGIYEQFSNNRFVKGAMLGLKGAVVSLIASVALTTAKGMFLSEEKFSFDLKFAFAVILLVLFDFLLIKKKINPIFIIIGSAVIGIVFNYAVSLL